jgi:hypothetical protein
MAVFWTIVDVSEKLHHHAEHETLCVSSTAVKRELLAPVRYRPMLEYRRFHNYCTACHLCV